MKKLGLSFAGVLFLFVFLSCSLANQNSSIAFNFPSDTSERLVAFKDARDVDTADSSSVFYVKFTSTGDWEYSVTKEYSKLEEINNAKFEFENLTAGNKINVSVEVGCNNVTYYKAEDTLTLVSGENQLSLKLKLVDLISDFSISAYYAKTPEIIFDGSSPIPVKDDLLTFTSTNTYSGSTKWDFNGTEFNGSFNPVGQKELTIKPFETNIVKLTVTDKLLSKVTKTQSFEFGFEGIPEKLTLSFEENAPENSENILIYGNKYKIGLAEAKSLSSETIFTWTLNKVVIDVNGFEFDTRYCDILSENQNYTLELTASLGDWSASGSINFAIAMGEGGINLGKAVPDFEIECSTNSIYLVDDDVNFKVKETTSKILNIGTEYTWYLNGSAINDSNARTIAINFAKNNYVKVGLNKISVKASYNGISETKNYEFSIYEPLVPLFGRLNSSTGWKLSDNISDENEYLDSFCYDANHNIYIAVHESSDASTIKKYTYNKNDNSYGYPVEIAVIHGSGDHIARMTTDGNHIYGVFSENVSEMQFNKNNVLFITTDKEQDIPEDDIPVISLNTDFSAVSALVYNDGKLYVGGVDIEKEYSAPTEIGTSRDDSNNIVEENISVYSNKYVIKSYSLKNDGKLDSEKSSVIKIIKESEIAIKYPDLLAVSSPEVTNAKVYFKYQLNTIISDLAVCDNNIYALVNSYSENNYNYFNNENDGYGTNMYCGGVRVYTDLYNLTNPEEDLNVGVASQSENSSSIEIATRFLALKPKEFVLAVNGSYSGTKIKDVDIKKKTVNLRSMTGDYCFDELVAASGFMLNGETHIYKVESEIITE